MTRPASDQLVFDVLAEIAAGTTARIELCRIREPLDRAGRLVAVKRLHKHIAEDREFADMFFDEVWMTASLRHKNVVTVAGWGNDEDGTYLAVELVEGVSLARLMKTVFETGEMFSERMVVFLGSEMCAGLGAAHQLTGQDGEHLRLVHRDLTPGNVLIGFAGQIKITDFGLAKAKQRVTKTLTGLLKGHPQYMAPEMARGLEIDSRSDLFSLGVVLFELFTGQHPWAGASELEIMRVTAVDPPKDVLAIRPKLDRELASVVNKLLQKDPNERFQNADEVRARLLNWLDTHGYTEGNEEALGRFVRRNAMRQQRWFERAVGGELTPFPASLRPGAIPTKRAAPESLLSAPGLPKPGAAPRVSPAPAGQAGSRAAHRRRRLREDEPTDISSTPKEELGGDPLSRRQDPPESSGDWGEEIPTVVKKKGEGPLLPPRTDAPSPAPVGGGPRGSLHLGGAIAAPTTDDTVRERDIPIPQFSLHDEDSASQTTAVQKDGTPRADERGRGIVDPPSDDAPTVPAASDLHAKARGLARPAGAPGAVPPPPRPVRTQPMTGLPAAKPGIPALPPPPVPSAETLPRPGSPLSPGPSGSPLSPGPTGPPLGGRPPDPASPSAVGSARVSEPYDSRPSNPVPPLRSGDRLFDEADRLAVEAVRLRDEATQQAEIAAQTAALAKLAHDAAALAAEAVRARAQGSQEKAELLLQDAYRLEDTLRRHEGRPERLRGSRPPPAVDPAQHSGLGPPTSSAPSKSENGSGHHEGAHHDGAHHDGRPRLSWSADARSPMGSAPPPSAQPPSAPPPRAYAPPVAVPQAPPRNPERRGDSGRPLAPGITAPLRGSSAEGAHRASRPAPRPAPRLLDQTLLGMKISTAIALVAAFVFAVVLLIAFATC